MTNLIQFLRARYDEEQREAAKQPDVDEIGEASWAIEHRAETNYPCFDYLRIAKARMLAEVEAKRRIVDECDRTLQFEDHGLSLARQVLQLLALPYAAHPDYREEWRP